MHAHGLGRHGSGKPRLNARPVAVIASRHRALRHATDEYEQGAPHPSGVRFVAPGERLRIWLKLDMSEDGQPADLFQVGRHEHCSPS